MKKVFEILNQMTQDGELDIVSELYRRKEAQRKNEAKRPVSEKMAAVTRLRDFERKLEDIRKANRAKRAAKQVKIEIKTR